MTASRGVEPVPTAMGAIVGVAESVQPAAWPVNGLRHSPGTTSGWFLWSGAEPGDGWPDRLRSRCAE